MTVRDDSLYHRVVKGRCPDNIRFIQHSAHRPEQLARYIAAQAMSGDPRWLAFGAGKRGNSKGPLDRAGTNARIAAAVNLVRPIPTIDVHLDTGREGAIVCVRAHPHKPGDIPFRVDGKVLELGQLWPHPMRAADVLALDRLAGTAEDELESVYGGLKRLDETHLARLIDILHAPERTDPHAALVTMGLLERPSRQSSVTRAAMAVLGSTTDDPTIVVRDHKLAYGHASAKRTGRALETEFKSGIVPCLDKVLDHCDTFTRQDDAVRSAVQEHIVNAFGHRSCAREDLGTPIAVEVYTDALVVTSPGQVLIRAQMSDKQGPRTHVHRNPHLMGMLTLFGLATGDGDGLTEVRRTNGVRARYFNTSNGFMATLGRVKPSRPARGERNRPEPEQLKVPQPASSRTSRILALVDERGAVSAKQLTEELGVSRSTIGNDLKRLVEDGTLEATGAPRSPNRRYRRP